MRGLRGGQVETWGTAGSSTWPAGGVPWEVTSLQRCAQAGGRYPMGNREPPRGHGTRRSLHHHTENGLERGWLMAQGPLGDS